MKSSPDNKLSKARFILLMSMFGWQLDSGDGSYIHGIYGRISEFTALRIMTIISERDSGLSDYDSLKSVLSLDSMTDYQGWKQNFIGLWQHNHIDATATTGEMIANSLYKITPAPF